MSSDWRALEEWLVSVDAVLAENAEHVAAAERVLSGSGFMEAVRVERRTVVRKRREREAARRERDSQRESERRAHRPMKSPL